jgi:protein TonB
MGFLRLLEEPIASAPSLSPVTVEVVELPSAAPVSTSPPAPKAAAARPLAKPQAVTPKPSTPTSPASPSVSETEREAKLPLEPLPPAAAEATSQPSALSTTQAPAQASLPPRAGSPGDATGGSRDGGRMSARAIFKPLPEIPEGLRRRNIELVAVARFRVAANGSALVELIEPTTDPELNRELLETLRRWRFFPAVQDGKPVASNLDIRIPISVK